MDPMPLRRVRRAFVRELLVCAKVLGDRRTPLSVKGLLVAAVLYGFFPLDLLPDFFPILGIIDDVTVILLPIGIAAHAARPIAREWRRKLKAE